MTRRDLPVFPLVADPVRPEVPRDTPEVSVSIGPVGPEQGPKVALITLGCDKNTVDSEKILATLVVNGARVSSEIEGSDVILVNTCGFIQSAKEQSLETILQASELREKGAIKALVVVGCMVERYKLELEMEIPEVDFFLGLTEMGSLIPELRDRGFLDEEVETIPTMERPLRILENESSHTSFLKISEGCDHTCAFCAIPSFRGLHRSAPLTELVAEAQALFQQGVQEINIISQDTTWYGRDLRRKDPEAPLLPGLLSALVQDTDIPWLRLFYMYPSGITQDVVELIGSENSILPYLDMPIQHGSDKILKSMRRPENQKIIRERVQWLRDLIPDLTL
ncbi:MAG TPA: radical SAM protein, partial [Gemmatimonadetes bacterium]|nr:radical SAM protein [Gemmatimonadota bacterium]